jgi:ABC-type transport system involved in multi-copper enzyme maturation permease subunit
MSTTTASPLTDSTTVALPVAARSTRNLPPGGSFARVVRAELQRVSRPRTVAGLTVGTAVFATVAGVSTFLSAEQTAVVSRRGGARLSDLTGAGGATEAFAVGASFAGFLVFVTFIALIAGEFSGGTFRAMLLRYPNRMRLIVGKFTGLLIVAAGAIALAELFTVGVSLAMAPGQDISTSGWFSADGLAAAGEDFGTALAGLAGWAIFGTTLAVVFRAIPLALGVGFAWAGPLENIIVESWDPGFRYFPGQVLGSLIRGGTAELGFGRAAVTAGIYTAIAAVAALVLISRRDVTS